MKDLLKLNFKIFFSLFLGVNLSFASEVKLLKKDFLKTKIGTIKDQTMITKIIIPKKNLKEIKTVVKKIKPKIKRKHIPVSLKKENFKKIMVPIVRSVYFELENKYKMVRKHIHMKTESEYIEKLKVEYKADSEQELLHAIKPHPISIVLAQSAIESAWLTSRFAKEANNIFGVWSFSKNEPRIAASNTRGDKTIYLKKYKNYTEAVRDYYKSIAKSWAYPQFRYLRTVTNDPYILLPHLKSYSEKGEVYTNILAKMIKSNKFYQYDIKE